MAVSIQNSKKYADDVHAALLSGILEGKYQPGDILNEIPLAEEFGVSRTPVREALQRLSAASLVERGPRRAVIVSKVPIQTLYALFEAMGEVEALVARFAALRMSELERQALNAAVEAGEDSSLPFEEVNRRFHKALRNGAHNPVLEEVLDDLEMRSMPWRLVQFRRRADRIAPSQREHRAIAAAITAQDANEAQRLMRAHIAATFGTVLEIFSESESISPPERK